MKDDTDPRYANWNPKNYWDFKYLGKPTYQFDSCGIKDLRGFADSNIIDDLMEEFTIPSDEEAFKDAISFMNWLPLVDLNNNN